MSRSLGSLTVDLLMKTGAFETDTGRAARIAQRRAKEIERAFDSAMDNAAKKVAGFVAGLALTDRALAGFGKLVTVQRQFDVLNAQLITATGSTQAAGKAFDQLQKFAAKTPFALEQSVQAFVKLKNLGLEPTEQALTSYGNTAAAMGKDLNQLIEAVADAATGEFERLKEFGIKAKQEGDKVSLTFQGVTTTIGKSSTEIQDYLIAIGETDFAGAMERRMDSLDGKLSNLADEFDKFFLAVAERGLGQQFTSSADAAAQALGALNEKISAGEYDSLIESTSTLIRQFTDLASNAELLSGAFDLAGEALTAANDVFNVAGAALAGLAISARGTYDALAGLLTLDFDRIKRGLSGYGEGQWTAFSAAVLGKDATGKPLVQPGRETPEEPGPDATDAALSIFDNLIADAPVRRSSSAGGSGKGKSDKDEKGKAERLAAEQKRWREEVERTAAALQGPLRVAEVEHAQRLAEIEDAYRDGRMTLEVYGQAKDLEAEKLRRTREEITLSQDVMGQLSADYAEQLRLAGLTVEEYTVEAELIRRVNDAKRAGVDVTDDMVDAMREQIRVGETQLRQYEELRKKSEEMKEAVQDSARNIADSLGGVLGGVIDAQQNGQSFWDALRGEAVRALGDIGKEFAKIRKNTKDWGEALDSVKGVAKDALPTLGQIAGTVAGGGGQGAALGASIGGIIGGYFGPWGAAIGAVLGGALGGTFDDDPEIQVGLGINKPEQSRSSRLASFQVRTESMTDPTSRKVADSIVELDNLVFDMLDTAQRAAVRGALSGFFSKAPTLEDILVYRFDAMLGALDKNIGDFVRDSSTSLQVRMQNLGDVLELQRLEGRGDLLTGSLQRALDLIKEFGKAGETAGQTYQRLGTIALNYGQIMTGVNRSIEFNGLNEFQQQQVEIELQYRSQARQLNDLARAFGLSGARAEDLAQLEQWRALQMAEVQRQMEEAASTFLTDLSLSELSPLQDSEKLGTAMSELRAAVLGGNLEEAQRFAETALGLGRNLYASGSDYTALYTEVTDLIRQVADNATMGLTDDRLREIADSLDRMPEDIARELFDLLVVPPPPTTPPRQGGATLAPVLRPGIVYPDSNGGRDGMATISSEPEVVNLLRKIASAVGATATAAADTATTNRRMAESALLGELRNIGSTR